MADDGGDPNHEHHHHQAATKIQAMARGRQTRHVLSNNTLDGARAIFDERQALRDRNMDASQLARTNKPGEQDGRVAIADREVMEAAKKYKNKSKLDQDRAAVQMQSLYRGFRDRKQVRSVREGAEKTQRDAENAAQLEGAKRAEAALHVQSQFSGYSTSHQDYANANLGARKIDSTGVKSRKTANTAPTKKTLAPTLVDKKAIMNDRQRAACLAVEDIIFKWASSYARAVELRPGAEKTGALEFVALFSKPSKEESIAWPVVRVNFTVPEDFEGNMLPKITYRLEDERMVYDVTTDFGRCFKESWLDRVVKDKRAIRADMALLHKK